MNNKEEKRNTAPVGEAQVLLEELQETQVALGNNIIETTYMLRQALDAAGERLASMRLQLEKLRDLTCEVNQRDGAV
ncbi:hypothetical protein LJC56_11435 [Christensenellaceae bacterium OttesenSCG-928-K19]|nr:hypothetical protein [Christensenellaceae bacterium OttesenSCG-928-K19]